MKEIGSVIRVAVICDNIALQQQIKATLELLAEFVFADTFSLSDRLIRDLRLAFPEIILIDYKIADEQTLDIIDDLQLQFPEARIVTILPHSDPTLAQQVILAGAQAFIVQPFTQTSLQSTLRRVYELKQRHEIVQTRSEKSSEPSRPIKIISVFSPRGGTGCSSIAANLALALYESTNNRVLLLEGKLFFGHLDLLLNIRAQNNLTDLLPHASAVDDALVRDVIAIHASGIHVLVGPGNLQVAQAVRPDELYRLLMGVQRLYDYIVIDVGSHLTDNAVTLLDSSDRIIVVTTPDLASMRDTSRFIQTSRTLGYSSDKIMVVLNRAGVMGGVETKDVQTVLHLPISAQIPDDGPNALRALNRGVPILMRSPTNPISKAIRNLASLLLTTKVNGSLNGSQSQVLPSDSANDALMTSSLYG